MPLYELWELRRPASVNGSTSASVAATLLAGAAGYEHVHRPLPEQYPAFAIANLAYAFFCFLFCFLLSIFLHFVADMLRGLLRSSAHALAGARNATVQNLTEQTDECRDELVRIVQIRVYDGGVESTCIPVEAQIIRSPSVRIIKNLIRHPNGLELGLVLGVPRRAVGMPLHAQLSIGLLDFFRGGRSRDAEHLVVVLIHARSLTANPSLRKRHF